MKSAMEEIRTSKEECLEELTKCREKAIKEIKDFRQELEVILEKLEEESMNEVEKCFNQHQLTLQNEIEKADTELQIMKNTTLHLMKSEGNRAQQFVSVKVSQKEIASIEEILQALQPCMDSRIAFIRDSNLTKYLQELKSLGSIKLGSTLALRQGISAYVMKAARELNVKTQDDSNICHIHGSCLTDDRELLLADSSNKKLKRVDIIKMSVVDQCNLPGSPYSVCQTKRKEVVVTLKNNSIQFISLDGQMRTTRKITLHHCCYGIAYKDDRFYITDYGSLLFIHDIAGTLLQTVSTDESGNNLFKYTRHVVFSDTGNKLFIADKSKGVIVFDDHMKHSYSFSDSDLSGAWAVCSDGRGNIFVSSHNVIQIDADGKKVGIVVKSSDGLSSPLSMCFYRKRRTLIITQASNNFVKLFDLK